MSGWLKEFAPSNIPDISVTLDVAWKALDGGGAPDEDDIEE